MIKVLQQQSHLSAHAASEALGLGYRQLLRWQERTKAGAPALVPPGPKKTGPLPLAAVRAEVEALRHHPHRSEGTGALYQKHQGVISRRELARLVAEERGHREQARRRLHRRVTWHVPNVAWAIDATERGRDRQGRKLFVHAVQDLCSRYRFAPLLALESKGPAVAEHLDKLFRRHGAPLFLKRDNGSPLNAAEVDAVLAEHGVIPLNSPAHYPRYNGAIEKGIREVQEALGACLVPRPVRWQPAALLPYVVAVQHQHQPHAHYTKRERLAIFEWIRIHAKDRIHQLEKIDQRSVRAAWRRAAETWLRCQGLITVSINQKVLPNLPLKYVHD
jgi:transposase InsO family protein